MGCTPGFEFSIGFDEDWPSAAYELVMESITDWAFSWPISMIQFSIEQEGGEAHVSEWEEGRTLVVVDDVSEVVASAVVGLAHTHRVMCKVHIAVIAWGVSVQACGSWSWSWSWRAWDVTVAVVRTYRRLFTL